MDSMSGTSVLYINLLLSVLMQGSMFYFRVCLIPITVESYVCLYMCLQYV